MDFLKLKKFRKVRKPKSESDLEENPVPHSEEPNNETDNVNGKTVTADAPADDDDDDDFITNEVKRRLKELRRNSFMVLIPEESELEEEGEEEGETSSSEGRDMGWQVEHLYCDFESIYEKYCERMLFFDRISAQQLNEADPKSPSTPSPRTPSRKLASPFRCLSLKKMEEPDDSETEQLQQPDNSPYQDLETAYVAHICLTWEALHSQYTQLSQKISCQPENSTCYNHCAQQYQQFQVLLQRFIENEPFDQGLRMEKYARSRNTFSKLLQVPNVQGNSDNTMVDEESDYRVLAPDLRMLLETSILTFYVFLRRDKKKTGVRNPFGGQNQMATPLQQVQSVAEKKMLKLKELKKKKALKKKSWPGTHEEVELLFSLIDAKVVCRVLRMVRITKDQLLWCEDKMRKLDLTHGRLRRDPSPILFPC